MPETAMRERLRKSAAWRSRIAFAVAFLVPVIITSVALLLAGQVRTANAVREAEATSQLQRALLLKVLSAHQDIETGSRGYIITGNPVFLEPYVAGRKDLLQAGTRLRQTYQGQPDALALLDRLRGLSIDKQRIIAQSIALERGGRHGAAASAVASGRGKTKMDAIRDVIAALLVRENANIAETSRKSEAAIARQRIITFTLLGVLTAMLGVAGLAIRNTLRSRDQALAAVEDQALRREAILNSARDAIITLNPSGTIESLNASTLRMFGYDESELARRDVGMLIAGRPKIGKVAEALREMNLVEGSEGTSRELIGLRSDGSEFPVEAAFTVTILTEGLRYVAVIRDVTERKRVEQLKSEFVSTVSHELRTPLTSIAGALGLLSGGAAGELDPRAARLITIAHNNAQRLVRLINDILDIEKIESGKMPFKNVELDLHEAVASSIEENRHYAAGFGVTVMLAQPADPIQASPIHGGLIQVRADRDRLAQIFTNLLSNASKFSPPGGVVEVTITPGEHIHRVTIADRGAGIPLAFRDRVFSKFAQADSSDSRQKGGTGLGLSIVSEIAQRLGGTVTFESEEGVGTCFHVDLPAVPPRLPRAATAGPGGLLVCGNGAGTAFSDALRRSGYQVTYASSVQAACDHLAMHRYDGIIVDMGLRQGLGIEIIRMVRQDERHAGTPILALGGKPGATELEGDAALVLDWLRKPLEVDRLVGSVDAASRALGSGRPRVLHVEDDPDVIALVAAALENRADVIAAQSLASARSALLRERFDLVILDLGLGDGSGIELLPALRRESETPIPVVVFSAQDAEPETAGLVDAYLTKARTPLGALVAIVESLTASRTPADKTGAPSEDTAHT